jgi:hypothetical protein
LQQKKTDQAFDLLLNSDEWVKRQFEDLKADTSTSSEHLVARIRELQTKASSVGADISSKAKANLDAVAQFYETASKRSETMVERTLQLAGTQRSAPMAMIIGAAHTDKVTELLRARNVAFVVLSPIDLNPKSGSLTLEQFERKSKGQWARNSPGTLGRVLNQERKPPPVVERTSREGYASMNLVGMLLAKAARSGRPLPDSVWPQIEALPGIRVDKDSIQRDGTYDVIFRAWLKDDQNHEKEVWARVGTLPKSQVGDQALEKKLLDSIGKLKNAGGEGVGGGDGGRGGRLGGGHNGEPPDELPPNSRRAENEGPGDAQRRGIVISRTGMDTLGVYGSRREDVQRVGLISREI